MWDAVDLRLEDQGGDSGATGAPSGSKLQALRALAAGIRLVAEGMVVFVSMPGSLALHACPPGGRMDESETRQRQLDALGGAAHGPSALGDMIEQLGKHGFMIAPISEIRERSERASSAASAFQAPWPEGRDQHRSRAPQPECGVVMGVSTAQALHTLLLPALQGSMPCSGSGARQHAFEFPPLAAAPLPSAPACRGPSQQTVIMLWPHQQHFRAPRSPLTCHGTSGSGSAAPMPCALVPPSPGQRRASVRHA